MQEQIVELRIIIQNAQIQWVWLKIPRNAVLQTFKLTDFKASKYLPVEISHHENGTVGLPVKQQFRLHHRLQAAADQKHTQRLFS